MISHRTASRSLGAALSVSALLLSSACSSPPPAAAPKPVEPAPRAEPQAERPVQDDASHVTVSKSIRERCGISEESTYFSYDSSRVGKQADSLLSKIVACFTTGPLAGESLSLVGHADPRGDEEYNYVLGGRRASEVEQRLHSLGLPQSKASTTSRGESHASGTDESSWARDRRVDLEIAGAG